MLFTLAYGDRPPCSLNGALQGTLCKCYPPWSGEDCGVLDERPGLVAYGASPDLWSWGGNVINGGSDGSHHLFVAEMEGHCNLTTWTFNSACVHATSTTGPMGPYTRTSTAVPIFCHNPQVLSLPDGTLAMFHIGPGTSSQPQENCSTAAAAAGGDDFPALSAPPSQHGGSSLHLASSVAGPWVPSTTPPPSCNNPAPMLHPNGTLFLVCDSNTLYSAPGIGGPWALVTTWSTPNGGPWGAYEDAFLWLDARGAWHMLFHVWTNQVESQCVNATVSAHAFSSDGLQWFVGEHQPYNTSVAFTDGHVEISPTRERPKLVFAGDGVTPLFLVNGAVTGGSSCFPHWCSRCKLLLKSYTLILPLGEAGERVAHSARMKQQQSENTVEG